MAESTTVKPAYDLGKADGKAGKKPRDIEKKLVNPYMTGWNLGRAEYVRDGGK